jgi:asparagine N-glycosylation enzyme membrane subunit Stt3
MLWIGVFLTAFGTLAYLFKLYVVWDVSRDVYNGGGVPTLDLPVVYPIFISMGLAGIIRALDSTPFPYFGLVVWVAIVLVTIALMALFDALGKPVREEQSRQIQERNRAEKHDG